MGAKVELYTTLRYEGSNDDTVVEHRWRLLAGNGEIVASGEAHTRREDAERSFLRAASIMYTVADQLKRRPVKAPGEDIRESIDRNPGLGPND